MTRSTQAGKRRGAKASPVALRSQRSARGAPGGLRTEAKSMEPDEQRFRLRQATVAPRAEPSTRGARRWASGRKQVRKYR